MGDLNYRTPRNQNILLLKFNTLLYPSLLSNLQQSTINQLIFPPSHYIPSKKGFTWRNLLLVTPKPLFRVPIICHRITFDESNPKNQSNVNKLQGRIGVTQNGERLPVFFFFLLIVGLWAAIDFPHNGSSNGLLLVNGVRRRGDPLALSLFRIINCMIIFCFQIFFPRVSVYL